MACQTGHLEVARALLSAGATVDLQSNVGNSPLWIASQNGHYEVVRALLSSGAQVDFHDNVFNASPLFVACSQGHAEVARALLSAGAKVDLLGQGRPAEPGWRLPPAHSVPAGPHGGRPCPSVCRGQSRLA